MDKLLTTKQVQDLLKVDRITVYRMLNDGRLKGIKIGNHWRFAREEIGRFLGEPAEEEAVESNEVDLSDFPTECVEKLQGVFAGILGVGAITVNLSGEAITEPVFSNRFCRLMLSNPSSKKACQESWRKIAMQATGNPKFHVCHAGLCYLRSPIKMDDKTVAYMVTGQFYISSQNPEEIQEKIVKVSQKHQLPLSELSGSAMEIPVLKNSQQTKVIEWAPKVSETVQSMLCERSDLVNRLERIAEISSIRPSLSKATNSE